MPVSNILLYRNQTTGPPQLYQLARGNNVHDGNDSMTDTDVNFSTKKQQKGKQAQIEPGFVVRF